MEHAFLHFHATLQDFIAPHRKHRAIAYTVDRKASVKDIVESHNVPHTEIDLIIVNGTSVGFEYIVRAGDDIQVYPAHTAIESDAHNTLRHLLPPIPAHPRFIIDANLGRLARYLRLLGFDCVYHNDFDDHEIADISNITQRIVLTRDRKLLQRKLIIYGYFVRAEIPKTQVSEILSRFNLYVRLNPLTRCTTCNGALIGIEKRAVTHRLKPLTRQFYHRFLVCTQCGQIYWQGSHSTRVKSLIEELSGSRRNA